VAVVVEFTTVAQVAQVEQAVAVKAATLQQMERQALQIQAAVVVVAVLMEQAELAATAAQVL
jgi:hypothetical protein